MMFKIDEFNNIMIFINPLSILNSYPSVSIFNKSIFEIFF